MKFDGLKKGKNAQKNKLIWENFFQNAFHTF